MRGGNGLRNPSGMDEVDEMLRAAEDELLLNLTKSTHTTAHYLQPPLLSPPPPSASHLDPDLARRFEALKAPPLPRPKMPEKATPATPPGGGNVDDLMARFTALKGSTSPSAGRSDVPEAGRLPPKEGGGDWDVSKEEVDKVMQWAMDAARLDASSGKGDVGEGSDSEGTEEEDEEERERERMKRRGKKWFFF